MILFVNACIRGERSRTLELCREFLTGLKQRGACIREVNLEQAHLLPLGEQKVAFRSQLTRAKLYDDDIFDFAHQIAEADEVVIGAPYWDLSFPAALKTYIEHVSVEGITFHYTDEGVCEGLCRAKRIVYITTSGGLVSSELDENGDPKPGCNLGYDYVRAIAKMFGIPETRCVSAEGLDIVGVNINDQMDKARTRIEELLAEEPEDAEGCAAE